MLGVMLCDAMAQGKSQCQRYIMLFATNHTLNCKHLGCMKYFPQYGCLRASLPPLLRFNSLWFIACI